MIDVEKNIRFRPSGKDWREWQDADNYSGPDVYCEVQYRFIVTSIGNVELINIELFDSGPDLNDDLSYIMMPSSLSPGDDPFIVILDPYEGQAGGHHNIATAVGY